MRSYRSQLQTPRTWPRNSPLRAARIPHKGADDLFSVNFQNLCIGAWWHISRESLKRDPVDLSRDRQLFKSRNDKPASPGICNPHSGGKNSKGSNPRTHTIGCQIRQPPAHLTSQSNRIVCTQQVACPRPCPRTLTLAPTGIRLPYLSRVINKCAAFASWIASTSRLPAIDAIQLIHTEVHVASSHR